LEDIEKNKTISNFVCCKTCTIVIPKNYRNTLSSISHLKTKHQDTNNNIFDEEDDKKDTNIKSFFKRRVTTKENDKNK